MKVSPLTAVKMRNRCRILMEKFKDDELFLLDDVVGAKREYEPNITPGAVRGSLPV